MEPGLVFVDPSGLRRRRVSRAVWLGACGVALALAIFVAGIGFGPEVPSLRLPATAMSYLPASAAGSVIPVTGDEAISVDPLQRPAQFPAGTGRPLVIGFYTVFTRDDETAFRGLERALPSLDWLMPTWLRAEGPAMNLAGSVDARVLAKVRRERPDLSILPTLQNIAGAHWDGAGLAHALADPAIRRARIAGIVSFLAGNGFQGVTVDFEGVPASAHADLRQFLAELLAALRPRHLRLVLAVPFDDDEWDYAAYARVVDDELLMAYDEHTEADRDGGSVAGAPWFDEILRQRMQELDPRHTIVGIGSYGYDWAQGRGGKPVTFEEAMARAGQSKADIVFDRRTRNPHFAYRESDGSPHDVWFLDGATVYDQVRRSDGYRPLGYAVWRVGSEDPSIWSVLGRGYGAAPDAGLRHIEAGANVNIQGDGEILQVVSQPVAGARSLAFDARTGQVDDEHYDTLPQAYAVQRAAGTPGEVALTFDDGPDARWTPRILDILKAKRAPATFFVVGRNMQASPALVRRMVDEGHEVGNHTFSHRNYAHGDSVAMWWQLAATQRLFESMTGRSLRLFRPPYLGNAEPTDMDELLPMLRAQDQGYLTVGLHVDSDDWEASEPAAIVRRVLEQLSPASSRPTAQVILLHDGGGDRSATAAALPLLIDALRAKGYRLVTASRIAGLSREQSMPLLSDGAWSLRAAQWGFAGFERSGQLLRGLFLATVGLGVLRALGLAGLAAIQAERSRCRRPPVARSDTGLVSVLIPAYNEENVILDCVRCVLRSRYRALEVIVVDDGSTDATAAIVRQAFAQEPRVRLLSLPNAGKARAIHAGLALARGGIVVALDADTQFERATIGCLVRWFGDPRVGAVAGNAKVGNRVNLITRWQSLEYITTQNLERRALALLGTLTVVPGAVGAWRRSALDRLGGFPADTLAEDQDLTLALQKAGYRTLFDSEAVAWTEAPDSVAALIRQRIRWSYGTLQCLWKHRDALLRPRYGALGLVALPHMWVFQYLFSLLAPLVDALFVWQIAWAAADAVSRENPVDTQGLAATAGFYGLFMAVDLFAGALAFALERKESWRVLPWLAVQRVCYRPLLYVVVIRSIAAALSGSLVAWGRQQRRASVHAPVAATAGHAAGYRPAARLAQGVYRRWRDEGGPATTVENEAA